MDKKRAALEFLKAHKVGILSTASSQGKPWGAAIYFAVDEDFDFYFLTHISSAKYKNIHENKSVALTVVDDYAQTTIQVSGEVDELTLSDERDRAFQLLATVHPPGQFAWAPPVAKLHEGTIVVMKLKPNSLRMSNFKPSTHTEASIVTLI